MNTNSIRRRPNLFYSYLQILFAPRYWGSIHFPDTSLMDPCVTSQRSIGGAITLITPTSSLRIHHSRIGEYTLFDLVNCLGRSRQDCTHGLQARVSRSRSALSRLCVSFGAAIQIHEWADVSLIMSPIRGRSDWMSCTS